MRIITEESFESVRVMLPQAKRSSGGGARGRKTARAPGEGPPCHLEPARGTAIRDVFAKQQVLRACGAQDDKARSLRIIGGEETTPDAGLGARAPRAHHDFPLSFFFSRRPAACHPERARGTRANEGTAFRARAKDLLSMPARAPARPAPRRGCSQASSPNTSATAAPPGRRPGRRPGLPD